MRNDPLRLTNTYRYASIADLRHALDSRQISAAELAAATCADLAQLAPRYNGLAALLPERSADEARAADERFGAGTASGPLDGIPYGAKDLFAARGAPTTWGSPSFRDQRFDHDAVAISRLRAAGAVLTAKTTMAELAGGGRAMAPGASLHGQGRNPWNPERYSGGSSTGSGITVALGLLPFALGTETGGSVVGPAAFSGITGIRPTFGLVPRSGVMFLSPSLDKVGVLARTAEDCAQVMAVIAGPDEADQDSIGEFVPADPETVRGLRVGIFARDAAEWDGVASAQLAAGMAEFEALTRGFVRPQFTIDGAVNVALEAIINDEAAQLFENHLRSPEFEMTDAKQLATLRAALDTTDAERMQHQRVRERATAAAAELFADVDAVLVSSRSGSAPRLDQPRAERQDTASDIMRAVANLAGLPGVSFPCGLAEDGLPVGLHLIGPRGSDAVLLAAAQAYQGSTDHHLLRPPDPTSA